MHVVEQRDPVPAHLVAAGDDRLREHVDKPVKILLVRQPVFELQTRCPQRVAHAIGVDEVARDRVADAQRTL